MDAPWRIELLGRLRATCGDRVVTRFRSQKTGVLLAYLAYHLHRPHPREALIDLLWPEADLASGRRNLSRELSSLRRQLEPPGIRAGAVIVADRFAVQLSPVICTTDVAQFEAALQAAARAESRTERAARLDEAVAFYQGELFPGCYEDWILPERERLAEAFHQALEQLIAHEQQAGNLPGALQWALRAVSADPLREEAHRELIRLLAAAGQPAAARRQYRELERLLKEKLEAEPDAVTRAVARELDRNGTGSPPPSTPRPCADDRPATVDRASPPLTDGSGRTCTLPTGTVTFLLTDIEGSTALWDRTGDAFADVLASHHALLRQLFRQYGGHEVKEMGDGFLVAFSQARDALSCAIAAQQALAAQTWPKAIGIMRVRMALHTGDVDVQDGDYHSLVLHCASRILLAGHGGQVLCSEATAAVLRLGLPPVVQLVDLGLYRLQGIEAPERLFQVNYPEMPRQEFPPLNAEAGSAGHLPLQLTRFFGREREIRQLREVLGPVGGGSKGASPDPGSERLVTLTGPGGTGKTRLALAAAAQLQEAFRGAVWFVPLQDLADPQLIVDQTLSVLRLPRTPGLEPLEQVVEALSRQPALLVLDNFEHLAAGAPLIRTLLERVATLTVLVTSRQRLNLPGEREFPVLPLPTPQGTEKLEELARCESVRLFVDRAQAVRPDFQVTSANAVAVAVLCDRLEGIPLALELAAARVQVLTPAQMLVHLERRLDFLVSRQRHAEARHRTLRAAIDWSYELLSLELQQFFARLSVFQGGWTLEAAEAICEEPIALEYLEELRTSSLVVADEPFPAEAGDTEMRFRMLETLREYAREQLAREEQEALMRRHAAYFLTLAEEAEPRLVSTAGGPWLERLEAEHDNLRAVLSWSVASGEMETGLRVGTVLQRFWSTYGARKGIADTALPTADAGYLTRRLVDVAQDVVVCAIDCGTHIGIYVSTVMDGRDVIEQLADRIKGRTALEPIDHPETGERLVEEGEEISDTVAQQIEASGVKQVGIRSPLACELRQGICAQCYGRDLATGHRVEVGTAVGIIAAQSIGEPAAQLTKEYLTEVGEVEKKKQETLKQLHADIEEGLVSLEEGAERERVKAVQAVLKVLEEQGRGLLRVVELFEARKPMGQAIISEIDGVVAEIESTGLKRVVIHSEVDVTQGTDKIVGETAAEDVVDRASGAVVVESGKEITERIARRIRELGILTVKLRKSHLVPYRGYLEVEPGQHVAAGDRLTEGPLDPGRVLDLRGVRGVQEYLVREIQVVYKSQGVDINDKHIEIIVRQMLKKRKIKTAGDTDFLPGQVVDKFEFEDENRRVRSLDPPGTEATADWLLLGITEVSLATDSFLSAVRRRGAS